MHRADGCYDRAHFIARQRVRNAMKVRGHTEQEIATAVWDVALWTSACRKHHAAFDNKQIRLDIDDYPVTLHRWAAKHGFEWMGVRDGWRAVYQGGEVETDYDLPDPPKAA